MVYRGPEGLGGYGEIQAAMPPFTFGTPHPSGWEKSLPNREGGHAFGTFPRVL